MHFRSFNEMAFGDCNTIGRCAGSLQDVVLLGIELNPHPQFHDQRLYSLGHGAFHYILLTWSGVGLSQGSSPVNIATRTTPQDQISAGSALYSVLNIYFRN